MGDDLGSGAVAEGQVHCRIGGPLAESIAANRSGYQDQKKKGGQTQSGKHGISSLMGSG
jgi:hypothetical protein